MLSCRWSSVWIAELLMRLFYIWQSSFSRGRAWSPRGMFCCTHSLYGACVMRYRRRRLPAHVVVSTVRRLTACISGPLWLHCHRSSARQSPLVCQLTLRLTCLMYWLWTVTFGISSWSEKIMKCMSFSMSLSTSACPICAACRFNSFTKSTPNGMDFSVVAYGNDRYLLAQSTKFGKCIA